MTRQLGNPKKQLWGFPGGEGGPYKALTWYRSDAAGPLAVAVSEEEDWPGRIPVLIALSVIQTTLTPTVEINIPFGKDAINRMVKAPRVRFLLWYLEGVGWNYGQTIED
ncbi:MAG: hypothetical protein NT009_05760 [Proteobacteria bacterium]|nr:hypothetical protein [Pseudomonadota bacterium]